MAYFHDEHGYAVFPVRGSRQWELCWMPPDEGYEVLDWFSSVASAKRAAAREVEREQQLRAEREAER
ncbi:MAG: hypothetical protein E6J41_25295 [Chloroflexi bacterium]|nr:MAG: hypothetical protein E6J41_25295 [Chloroflexota bacterium]